MGGIATPPISIVNPILAEIDAAHANLSPDAQLAIAKAHGIAPPIPPAGIAAPNGPATEPPPGGGIQAPAPTTVGSGIVPPGAASPKLVNSDAIPGVSEPAQDAAADNVSSAGIKPAGALGVPSLGSKIPETTPTPIGGKISPELARLTAPDTHQHNAQNTGTPGVNQIHSPWARVPLQILDALGRGFFPGVEMGIPGTSGHHDVLVHQRQAEDTQERNAADDAARRELESAQAEKDLHPGETKDWQEIAGGAIDPAHPELGPQPAFYNKNDPGQGIKFGNASLGSKASKEGGTVHEDKDGNYWVIHTDGSATQVAPKGTPLQGKGKEETGGTVHEDVDGNMWVVKGNGDAIPVKPKAEGTGGTAAVSAGGAPVPSALGAPTATETMTRDATPTTPVPTTSQLKGKTPAHTENAEQAFVDEYMKANKNATIAQAQRAFKLNEHLPPERDPTAALDRETTKFSKPHEKAVADATAQLEKIADARAMINGNAESQALGIPKVLTALVSGVGSGVRITQPELNAIGTARGVKGDVEGFINSVSGKGKLTDTQKQQLTGILNDVETRVRQKQAIANDALDKINGAGSRGEIIQHDKDARKALSDLETGHSADSAVKAYADKFFGGDLKKAQAAIDSQKKK